MNAWNVKQVTCLPSGSWNSAIPFCESVLCPDITNSSERILRTSVVSREVGGKAIFSCPPGYIIRGSTGESICQPNGEWTKPMPHCEGSSTSFPPSCFIDSINRFGHFSDLFLNGLIGNVPFLSFFLSFFSFHQRWFASLRVVRRTVTSKEEIRTRPVKWFSSTATADS